MTGHGALIGPLNDGDMLTIQWSGRPRTVRVVIGRSGTVWLRLLTADEERALAAENDGAPV